MPETHVDTLTFDDDSRTPNNVWPVVIHHDVAATATADPAAAFERLFDKNNWLAQWRGGVFDYHHYHSNAHEVLAVAAGDARLVLGGENGRELTVRAGDVLVLPAGTGHCRLEASADFLIIGGYPPDQQDYDLCRSGEADIERARARIARVPRPTTDPVTGGQGGLVDAWSMN